MLKLPKDRTIPLMIWLVILSCVSIWLQEDIPVLKTPASVPINLKVATLEDLMTIPKMQIRVAKAIFEKRDQVESWEDLRKIRGVGPKTLEQLKVSFVLK